MFDFADKIDENGEQLSCPKKLTKKQQAIVNRELELLELAKELVEEHGFAHFTMDKLTARSPYSKGTIYNHFCSKEDVILALCVHFFKKESQMLVRAMAYPGSAREKIIALHAAYHIFVQLEPVLSDCAITAKTPWVLEKTSPSRIEEQKALEVQAIGRSEKIVLAAIEAGDLQLSPGLSVDTIVFANWAIAFGSNALEKNAANCFYIKQIQDPYSIITSTNILLDGMNWKPLSCEWDYRKTWQKVEQELFAEEIAYLKSKGLR